MFRISILRALSLIGLLFICLLGVQAIFFLLQKQSAQTTEASLRGLLRDDVVFADTLELTRRLDDLEALGLFKCSVLIRLDPGPLVFVDNRPKRDDCVQSELTLEGVKRAIDLMSINGARWHFEFVSLNHGSFYLSLWMARILIGLVVIVASVWYWVRIDAKEIALAKEEENKRILEKRVREQSKMIADLMVEAAVQQSLTELAAQVSHDIRSPLSTLNMAVKTLTDIPDDKRRLIEQAAQRISGIANDLLRKYKTSSVRREGGVDKTEAFGSNCELFLQPTRMAQLLEEIYNEKQVAFANYGELNFRLDLNGPTEAVCNIDRKELARALSNLIDNAVEAVDGRGKVSLALRSAVKGIAVIISDNVKGIPEDLLPRLGKERVSYGKSQGNSGSGIGVLHARSVVEGMGGKFSIQSRVGMGTMVTMTFGRTDP